MRLIDADALMADIRKEVLLLYDKTKDECAEHLDLDDDRIIYLHGLDQYLKIKYAYQWIKCKVKHAPTIEIKEQNENEMDLSSHSEEDILKECIKLMNELVDDFSEWYEFVHGENAIAELEEEERFCVRKTYFSLVQQLFLYHTKHGGGGSTRAKCNSLGIDDWSEDIEFGFRRKTEDED